MAEKTFDLILIQTMAILNRYGFDLRGYTPIELLFQWAEKYSSQWIRLAVIEALYQGRYKSISVEQILRHWLRKGTPSIHFTNEFETLICQDLPYSTDSSVRLEFPILNNKDHQNSDLSESVSKAKSENNKDPKMLENIDHPSSNGTSPSHHQSITQFTPLVDHSQSYLKLRETVYRSLEDPQKESDTFPKS